ncbi:MAG: ABC transporter permease [Clostridia bacterium]|nr:ABC transporter permease [Clostridia bacterium]
MRRLVSVALKKISVLFGGKPLLLPLTLALLSLCFFAVRTAVTATRSGEVRMAAVDECGGGLSAKLLDSVASAKGFAVTVLPSAREARSAAADGEVEAVLIISKDYDRLILDPDAAGLITLLTAPGSVSADLIRETVSGKLIAQRAELRAKDGLAADGFSLEDFDAFAAEFDTPKLCRVESAGGGSEPDRAVFGRAFPGYAGFAALALMLVMLTLAKQLSQSSSRLVSLRMASLRNGRALDFAGDVLSVFSAALLVSAAAFAFAPERSIYLAAGLVSYSFCLTGLCLALSGLLGTGRIDMASPFIALVTSILGGCFVDPGGLSPAFSVISKFTPQGQLTAAAGGAPAFAGLLLAEGALLLAAALVIRRRRRGL